MLAVTYAGTTSLLRLIAGLQAPDDPTSVTYDGLTSDELKRLGVNMRRHAAYCGEADIHEPLLTVQETLSYAAQLSGGGAADAPHVDALIHSFGMDESANTIVGK